MKLTEKRKKRIDKVAKLYGIPSIYSYPKKVAQIILTTLLAVLLTVSVIGFPILLIKDCAEDNVTTAYAEDITPLGDVYDIVVPFPTIYVQPTLNNRVLYIPDLRIRIVKSSSDDSYSVSVEDSSDGQFNVINLNNTQPQSITIGVGLPLSGSGVAQSPFNCQVVSYNPYYSFKDLNVLQIRAFQGGVRYEFLVNNSILALSLGFIIGESSSNPYVARVPYNVLANSYYTRINLIYNQSLNDAYNAGVSNGSDKSYQDGYNNAIEENKQNWINQGIEQAQSEIDRIKNEEYTRGYNQAVEDNGSPYTFDRLLDSIFYAPLKAISSVLNFEILGVNVYNLASALFTLAIVIILIKIVFSFIA